MHEKPSIQRTVRLKLMTYLTYGPVRVVQDMFNPVDPLLNYAWESGWCGVLRFLFAGPACARMIKIYPQSTFTLPTVQSRLYLS